MNQIHQKGLAPKYLNKQVNKNSKTGHTGVCWREKEHKYYAYIMVDRKQISLGLHAKLDDAIAARKAAEEQYFLTVTVTICHQMTMRNYMQTTRKRQL
ncbi:hypothetical protein [Megasphaera sp.]|uniref:hypothetical protein n=1 Tax=Megasphaera sp. TaxID=2023260 RepID=UPI0025B8E048|nr:hypothetical protein [Megasphaera sp.]